MPLPEAVPGPDAGVIGTSDRLPVRTCVVIALRGELDLSQADLLRQRLGEARPTDDVVVDVSGVPFIDSVALGILARAALHHREHDRYVVLSGARPFVRKVLAITRLGGILPDASSVEQARELLATYSQQALVPNDQSKR